MESVSLRQTRANVQCRNVLDHSPNNIQAALSDHEERLLQLSRTTESESDRALPTASPGDSEHHCFSAPRRRGRHSMARIQHRMRALSDTRLLFCTPEALATCWTTVITHSPMRGQTHQRLAVVGDGVEVITCSTTYGASLRAARLFRKGEFITQYFGELVSSKEAKRRLEAGSGSHLCALGSMVDCIDGLRQPAEGLGAAQFANHAGHNDVRCNARLIRHEQGVFLQATRDVSKGQWIMISYGEHGCDGLFRKQHGDHMRKGSMNQLHLHPVPRTQLVQPSHDVDE